MVAQRIRAGSLEAVLKKGRMISFSSGVAMKRNLMKVI